MHLVPRIFFKSKHHVKPPLCKCAPTLPNLHHHLYSNIIVRQNFNIDASPAISYTKGKINKIASKEVSLKVHIKPNVDIY